MDKKYKVFSYWIRRLVRVVDYLAVRGWGHVLNVSDLIALLYEKTTIWKMIFKKVYTKTKYFFSTTFALPTNFLRVL